MYFLTRPGPAEIDAFLQSSRDMDFSYPELRATNTAPPDGYTIDHNRNKLGTGAETFAAAADAIRAWKMFDIGWVSLHPPNAAIEEGQNVAVRVSHLGFYSLNAARVVYTINDAGRFGFAYGTLTDHGESGEERFLVEIDPETEDVWYDLYAFSRPGNFLSNLGFPYARSLQKQFALDSMAAMQRAVNG